MTFAVATEAEVQTELWRSFISVLKSYAFLASVEGEPAVMSNLDDSPCAIVWSALCHEGRRRCCLNVSYDTSKFSGTWRVSADDEPFTLKKRSHEGLRKSFRPFTLNADGTVSLDGGVLDMDHAAIEMVGFFSSAIKSGEMEAPA